MRSLNLASLLVITACNHTEPAAPDAAPPAPDAPASAECGSGGTYGHVVLHGAFELVAFDAGPVTVSDKIVGVAGSTDGPDLFGLNLVDVIHGDLAALGDHDISARNLKYLKWPYGQASTCAPGPCTGFFASSGTLTVTAIAPRYQATFTLGDLHAHDDETNTMGAPLAGTVTGCIDVRPTP